MLPLKLCLCSWSWLPPGTILVSEVHVALEAMLILPRAVAEGCVDDVCGLYLALETILRSVAHVIARCMWISMVHVVARNHVGVHDPCFVDCSKQASFKVVWMSAAEKGGHRGFYDNPNPTPPPKKVST